ncbi:MAG: peptide deformylase [Planctomycetaceae bacterium]|nr:peptide deformylase [Planctomycetaceae bacterium]
MLLEIITYPHPTLRHKSKPIKRVDAELREVVREMFKLMYEAKGVGLAANQVDLPIRLFVANLEADPDKGEEMVFINPVVSMPKGTEENEEGCLSLPGLYGNVVRPKKVRINAYNMQGEEINADVEGLFSRVVQHETDHLDGVLFIDRMTESAKIEVEGELDMFETEFNSRRDTGGIPDNAAIAARLSEWEAKYC